MLNSISVWNDFINPQIILGPGSGIYTVTTGVYAAVDQYSTDYTVSSRRCCSRSRRP